MSLKLTYLLLEKYIPFSLSQIERLEYTPEKPIQLIVGTNGSGKTTLLRAIAPTPTDKKSFEVGGRKLSKWIDSAGREYILESVYDKKNRHSFKVDGVELNQGGTKPVQSDLVKNKMGYTEKLHKVLTQQLRFTEMNATQRENILIEMAGLDLGYPLGVYQKIKETHRDTIGTIKQLGIKYNELCDRIDTLVVDENLEEKIDELNKRAVSLMPMVNFDLPAVSSFERETVAKRKNVEHISKKLENEIKAVKALARATNITIEKWGGYNAFKENRMRLEGNKESLIKNENKLRQELSSIEEIVVRLDECPNTIDKNEIEQRLKTIEEEINSFRWSGKGNYSNYEKARDAVSESMQWYISFSNEIPINMELFSRDERRDLIESYKLLEKEISRLSFILSADKEKLKHFRLAKENDVVCPDCKKRIPANGSIDDAGLKVFAANVEKQEEELENKQKILDGKRERYDLAMAHLGLMRQVQNHIDGNPIVAGLWQSFGGVNRILSAKPYILGEFTQELREIERFLNQKKLIAEKEELNKYLLALQFSDKDVRGGLEKMTKDLDILLSEKQNLLETIKVFTSIEKRWDGIFALKQNLDIAVSEYIKAIAALNTADITDTVNNEVKSLQAQIGASTRTLNQWKELMSRRDYLKEEGEDLKRKKRHYEILSNSLSPKKGMIGHMLKRSISAICDDINDLLEIVWEHEFRLELPEEELLTFDINMIIDGKRRQDISLGSRGERDMIDMAFTLVYMSRKGLQSDPLFMDEVGSSFDYVHRKNLLGLIEDLVSHGKICQLFIVNHFSGEYGGITDADLVVMNKENIQLTGKTFNEVIKIN